MTIKIVGFTGSLRRGSFNKASLLAAQELLPEGANLEILDVSAFPFFNEDVEREGVPQLVLDFKAKVTAARHNPLSADNQHRAPMVNSHDDRSNRSAASSA